MKVFAGAAALLVLMPSLSVADDGFIGINYTQLEQDDRFFRGDRFDTGEVFVRLGAHINEYVSAEMRLGTTSLYIPALPGLHSGTERYGSLASDLTDLKKRNVQTWFGRQGENNESICGGRRLAGTDAIFVCSG